MGQKIGDNIKINTRNMYIYQKIDEEKKWNIGAISSIEFETNIKKREGKIKKKEEKRTENSMNRASPIFTRVCFPSCCQPLIKIQHVCQMSDALILQLSIDSYSKCLTPKMHTINSITFINHLQSIQFFIDQNRHSRFDGHSRVSDVKRLLFDVAFLSHWILCIQMWFGEFNLGLSMCFAVLFLPSKIIHHSIYLFIWSSINNINDT